MNIDTKWDEVCIAPCLLGPTFIAKGRYVRMLVSELFGFQSRGGRTGAWQLTLKVSSLFFSPSERNSKGQQRNKRF